MRSILAVVTTQDTLQLFCHMRVRAGANIAFGFVFELLDEVCFHRWCDAFATLTKTLQYLDYPRKFRTSPELAKRGKELIELLSKTFRRGLLKPGPVKLMESGLGLAPEGMKYILDGNVSGVKLTYRIADTPRNRRETTSSIELLLIDTH
jgi:hypothetical protein